MNSFETINYRPEPFQAYVEALDEKEAYCSVVSDETTIASDVTPQTLCPNVKRNFVFLNWRTNEKIPVPCNRYDCPVCGPKKAKKLYHAINRFFSKIKVVRLWTFTLSSGVAVTPVEHYNLLKEGWRRLTTELRRSKYLRADQRNFQYVRVLELHKSGYAHLHVLVTEYLPQKFVQSCWEHICQDLCNVQGHVASANVKGIRNSASAARYVVKYVLKCAREATFAVRRYSRSGKVALFPKHVSSGDWYFVRLDIEFSVQFRNYFPDLPLLVPDLRTTSQACCAQPP